MQISSNPKQILKVTSLTKEYMFYKTREMFFKIKHSLKMVAGIKKVF